MATCSHNVTPETERAIRTVADERAVDAGYWYSERHAQQVVSFFSKHLKLTIGGSRPFVLLPWQEHDFLRPLFGWRCPDGTPRFNRADLWVAKKNGKSTLAAGLTLFGLLGGGERAQVYGVAHTREQAGIVYAEAAAMARASTDISGRVKVLDSHKRITTRDGASFYQVLAGENCSRGVEGINPSMIVIDEIHVHRNRLLYDALRHACVARASSLILSISTVGVADPTTIWWEQYQYDLGVLSGAITDHRRFALNYMADEACVHDEATRNSPEQWRKANPSLGAAVTEQSMHDAAVEAENNPRAMGAFLRYRLNIPTAGAERIVRMDRWAECPTSMPALEGRDCYGGLDLASTEDLAAFALWFPPTDDDPMAWLIVRAWAPETKVRERRLRGLAHYGNWVERGWLRQTEGERVDYDTILADIRADCLRYNVREIGFDKWNADAVIQPLMQDGIECVAVPQTVVGLGNGTKALLDDIVRRAVGHEGNELMAWCLANCAGKYDGDAVKFDKKTSPEKIDLAQAAAMARGRALVADEAGEPGIF